MFGAVGGSITRFAIEGYNRLGGTRAWNDARLEEYGGGDIAAWSSEIGLAGSIYWGIFQEELSSEPGTDEIWWNILVTNRNDPAPVFLTPADKDAVIAVANEIRRLAGQSIPIYVSDMPDYGPATGCTIAGSAGVELARLMAEFAVNQGLALPGPDLENITVATYNGPNDPCHQGIAGREQHGQTLRAFFGG